MIAVDRLNLIVTLIVTYVNFGPIRTKISRRDPRAVVELSLKFYDDNRVLVMLLTRGRRDTAKCMTVPEVGSTSDVRDHARRLKQVQLNF